MKSKTIIKGCFVILFLFYWNPINSYAQTVTLSSTLSSAEVKANDEVILTLSVSENQDAYFLSAEIEFDPEVLGFSEIQNTGLTAGGLSIADLIDNSTVGASVTRTEALSSPASGDLMQLTFNVLTTTTVGLKSFTFSEVTFRNSEGELLEADPLSPAEFEVLESVTTVSLTTPLTIEVTEGESYIATADVFANGVSDDELNEGRIQTWIGVNDTDTDPSGWDEGSWQLMDFTGETDDNFQYESEIAFQRPLGTYYLAVRSELDTEAIYKYGGVNGNWDSTGNPSAQFTISEQPPFRYTLASWNFDDETLTPSTSLPQNDGSDIELIGASLSNYSSGSSGQAANSNGWDGYGTVEPKYWLVSISTENLTSIQISSKQYSSGTGPADFQLQFSTDGISWTDASGGTIAVATDFTTGVIDQLALPVSVNDQQNVFVRWLQVSDVNVNGETGISSSGTSRIDDVVITGVNPNAERVEVWAGDTNNDGDVNETDVLPLSAYWAMQGPGPVYVTTAWEARDVESWIPVEATYADADGDGLVGQNDLMPVGLHFGETRSAGKRAGTAVPLASLSLEMLNAGEVSEFYLMTEKETDLSGLSFHLSVSGISSSDWKVNSVDGNEWNEEWKQTNRLIEFAIQTDDGFSSAMAHRGFTDPVTTKKLAKVVISATRDWEQGAVINLDRVSAVRGREIVKPETVFLSANITGSTEPPEPTIPDRTELFPNYPNPFNPVTVIEYNLSRDSDVRIDVFNTIGARVATLVNTTQAAGEHQVPFDASSFSSGIYYYRLQTIDFVRTRSMVLIK